MRLLIGPSASPVGVSVEVLPVASWASPMLRQEDTVDMVDPTQGFSVVRHLGAGSRGGVVQAGLESVVGVLATSGAVAAFLPCRWWQEGCRCGLTVTSQSSTRPVSR